MAKFKLEISAPFNGYCLDWYKDTNNFVGSSNEATEMLNIDNNNLSFIRQGLAPTTIQNNTQLDTFFHGNTTGENVVVSSNEILLLADFDGTAEKFSALAGLPLALTGGTPYRANQPAFNVCRLSDTAYYYIFYRLNSGVGEIARATGFDGTPGVDLDWGSAVPPGKKALSVTYDSGFPMTRFKTGMAFGNGNYLGKLIDGTVTLASEFIKYSPNEYVYDLENFNGYIYVLTGFGLTKDVTTRSNIYLYDPALTETDYKDYFTLNARVSAIIVYNNTLYAFYRYSNSTDNWFGIVNGNKLQDIKKFDGELPNPWQCEVYQNGILFTNGSKLYHVTQNMPNGAWNITTPFTSTYSVVNSIMSNYNKILVGSTNNTLFAADVFRNRTVSSNWTSIATFLSDNNLMGMIDTMQVNTNKLASGARCDVSIYKNQSATATKTLTVNTVNGMKHLFRNIDISGIDEFKLKLDWSNGSATNLCDIRKITIYGHTTGK